MELSVYCFPMLGRSEAETETLNRFNSLDLGKKTKQQLGLCRETSTCRRKPTKGRLVGTWTGSRRFRMAYAAFASGVARSFFFRSLTKTFSSAAVHHALLCSAGMQVTGVRFQLLIGAYVLHYHLIFSSDKSRWKRGLMDLDPFPSSAAQKSSLFLRKHGGCWCCAVYPFLTCPNLLFFSWKCSCCCLLPL